MSGDRGWPPKVIHLEGCDYPLRVIEVLLRQNAFRFRSFTETADRPVVRLKTRMDRRCSAFLARSPRLHLQCPGGCSVQGSCWLAFNNVIGGAFENHN